ncbi:MAG: L-seryl-tRNA(Sec) selenium transferase [Clostridiales bacterium]|nr:L-seryl-tRNA(Sec) selenium transferase [Clostridiales bacterium]
MNNLLSKLPKVDTVLGEEVIREYINKLPRKIVVLTVRNIIDKYRLSILTKNLTDFSYEMVIEDIKLELNKTLKPKLRRVINATGTVIHTNLGRSPISINAINHIFEIGTRYNNLEYNLDEGKRGSRYSHVEEIICQITGAEAALVVNNNAAAVMLVLSTLAKGKEAIVSRGQLVEIGGSFRIPSVMEQSGAILVEVGTTNRTHLYDYENAINENTAAILKVHQSNFKILGFTEEVSIDELVDLSHKNNIPLIEDIGSGVLVDLTKYGLNYEPTVQESIKKGVDIVTFSGDKLLGGPQAGIIVGKRQYIDKMKKNQLTRALRIDKFTLAGLETTLKAYLDEENLKEEIPIFKMLSMDTNTLKRNAQKLAKLIKTYIQDDKIIVDVKDDYSTVGGGAMPLETIPTYVVAIKPKHKTVEELEKSLRMCEIPIIVRVSRDYLLLDVRTLFDDDYAIIAENIKNVI